MSDPWETETNSGSGVFAGMGLEKVATNPQSKLPDGTYTGFVKDANIMTKKDGTRSLVLTYKVEDIYSDYNEEEIKEWRRLPQTNPDGNFKTSSDETNARFLKIRLQSLGIDANVFESLKLESLIGIAVTFTTSTNGEYKNVKSVKLRETIGDNIDRLL